METRNPAHFLPADRRAARSSDVIALDVFSDFSGVSALLRCGRYQFACSYTGVNTLVAPVTSRRSTRRVPAKYLNIATADFRRLVDANTTSEYRAQCVRLYNE